MKEFAKSANQRSNGRTKIQVFADPELEPAEQLFESCEKGTLESKIFNYDRVAKIAQCNFLAQNARIEFL